jgi:superfamily I DNA and/or RNA helicase
MIAARSRYPHLFGGVDGADGDLVTVQTVDLFQGDENKYVIVSLVRSGVPKLGFLEAKNRRC